MSRRDLGLRAIFGAPLVLAGLSLTGLVGALLYDGVWDGIGAALLAAALAVAFAARMRTPRMAAKRGAPGTRAGQPSRVRIR